MRREDECLKINILRTKCVMRYEIILQINVYSNELVVKMERKQIQNLVNLLNNSKKKIEFYQNQDFDELSADAEYEMIMEKYTELPIVDKTLIKENMVSFIDNEILEGYEHIVDYKKDFGKEYIYQTSKCKLYVEYTSGTSGMPFLCIKTINERIRMGCSLWKLRNQFSSVSPEMMINIVHNSRYPFPFDIVDDRRERTLKELDYLSKSNYLWWHINGFQLENYYKHLLGNDKKFPKLKVIENNGSYISEKDKEIFGNRFDALIANNYGCREVWTIAYDCPMGYLHVNEHRILFELVDEYDNIISEPNKIGYVVVTALDQFVMPFIRYRIGDMAYYIDGVCSCGNLSRRIVLVPGRNMIEGTDIYGNVVFRQIVLRLVLSGVKDFGSVHIVQNDIDKFIVNVSGNLEDKKKLESNFTKIARQILKNEKYRFLFTYENNVCYKSLFDVKRNVFNEEDDSS